MKHITRVVDMRTGTLEYERIPQIKMTTDLRTGHRHAPIKSGALWARGFEIRDTEQLKADMRGVRMGGLFQSGLRRIARIRDWFADGTDLSREQAETFYRENAILEASGCYCDEIAGLCEVCEEHECGCFMPGCIWCDPNA